MSTLSIASPVMVEASVPTIEDMTGSKVAAVTLASAGFVLSMVGLMVGMVSHTVGFIDCGSGFSPNPNIIYTTECFAMTDSARTFGLVLLVPGVLALLVGVFMMLAGAGGTFQGMFHQPTLAELEARSHADA